MLNKTIATTGGLLAAVGSGIIITLPTTAQAATHDTWGNGPRNSTSTAHYHRTRNRNWNANDSEGINRIRIPIRNNNSIVNVARTQPTAAPTTTVVPMA